MAEIETQVDYHTIYEQIDATVDCYHDNFEQTFNSR